MSGRNLAVLASVAALAALGWFRGGASTASGDGRPAAGEVSAIIYPPAPSRITVHHAHPAHRRLRCERCHVGASADEGRLPVPPESTCLPCHEHEVDRGNTEGCSRCHGAVSLVDAGVIASGATAPPTRLKFSHRVHSREECGVSSVTRVLIATRRAGICRPCRVVIGAMGEPTRPPRPLAPLVTWLSRTDG